MGVAAVFMFGLLSWHLAVVGAVLGVRRFSLLRRQLRSARAVVVWLAVILV
jgi:hypothetical protein